MTNNIHKFNEARRVLAQYNIAVAMLRVKPSEIQDDNIEKIAKSSAIEAYQKTKLPVIVEDAGLFIDALKGFPGPYSSYVYRTIGKEGILKLLEESENRKARFKSVVASAVQIWRHGASKEPLREKYLGLLEENLDLALILYLNPTIFRDVPSANYP